MPQEHFSIELHGINVRQTVTAPETHLDIHPTVLSKLLKNISANYWGGAASILLNNTNPPSLTLLNHTEASVVENVL